VQSLARYARNRNRLSHLSIPIFESLHSTPQIKPTAKCLSRWYFKPSKSLSLRRTHWFSPFSFRNAYRKPLPAYTAVEIKGSISFIPGPSAGVIGHKFSFC
jgi:hypothetical protein